MDFDEEDLFNDPADQEDTGQNARRKRQASSTSSSDSEEDLQTQALKSDPTISGKDRTISMPIGSARRNATISSEEADDKREDKARSKLGTSMPINIRQNPSQAALKTIDQQDDEQRANTFVAFHNMDQPADYSIKNASLSNGSVAKRERLLQRNKILRRTGFIEGEPQMPGLKSGPEPSFPELMDPLNRRMLPIKESHLEASALSAALGSPNPHRQTALPE